MCIKLSNRWNKRWIEYLCKLLPVIYDTNKNWEFRNVSNDKFIIFFAIYIEYSIDIV